MFGRIGLAEVLLIGFVGLVTVLVFGLFLYVIVRLVTTSVHNRQQPLLTRRARVVGKRLETSGGMNDISASTWYYVTFEFPDGSREEFGVGGQEYGLLVEGDYGTLQSQGSWFKGFQRDQL